MPFFKHFILSDVRDRLRLVDLQVELDHDAQHQRTTLCEKCHGVTFLARTFVERRIELSHALDVLLSMLSTLGG